MSLTSRTEATLFLSLSVFCLTPFVHATPRMTPAEVAKTCQQFSLGVAGNARKQAFVAGSLQSGPTTTIQYFDQDNLPADLSEKSTIISEDHPHGFWKIEKQKSFEIEIDDLTGKVLRYFDYAASSEGKGEPAGEAISKTEALKLAEAALLATGTPLNNLRLNYIQEEQRYGVPTAGGHRLGLNWTHTFHGIPALRYGPSVTLAAETGRVISVFVEDQLIDPLTTVENVTREQALTISAAQLNADGVTDIPLLSIQKQLVPINRYWETGDSTQISRQTRAAWNCEWGYPGKRLRVWVDTETGDVIGGEYEGGLGGHQTLPKPKFGHQLKHTEVPLKIKAMK